MACLLFPLSLQLIFPDLVEGLVLMNIDPNGKGWIDWAATKVSTKPTWPVWESSGLSRASPWLSAPPAALWLDQHLTRYGTLSSLQPGKAGWIAFGVSSRAGAIGWGSASGTSAAG